jgi:Mrp family chromosome partitioning ATPase
VGIVLGFTTARSLDWKRGVAANVAARLAADGVARVAVVDADPRSCDVGDRLGMTVRGRLEWPDLTVVPLSVSAKPAMTAGHIRSLADRFDIVVVDLPAGAGAPGPVLESGLLERVDRLVVMTELSVAALRSTRRWAELVSWAKNAGHVQHDVEVVAAVCDEEVADDGARSRLATTLGLPVVASVPQLWGRIPPNLGFGPTLGFPVLDQALRSVALLDATGNSFHADSSNGQSCAPAHAAVSSVK